MKLVPDNITRTHFFVLLMIIWILNIVDTIQTLSLYFSHILLECNLIIAKILYVYGPWYFLVFKFTGLILFTILICFIFYRDQRRGAKNDLRHIIIFLLFVIFGYTIITLIPAFYFIFT